MIKYDFPNGDQLQIQEDKDIIGLLVSRISGNYYKDGYADFGSGVKTLDEGLEWSRKVYDLTIGI